LEIVRFPRISVSDGGQYIRKVAKKQAYLNSKHKTPRREKNWLFSHSENCQVDHRLRPHYSAIKPRWKESKIVQYSIQECWIMLHRIIRSNSFQHYSTFKCTTPAIADPTLNILHHCWLKYRWPRHANYMLGNIGSC
jgi:hypothetical protein